MYDLFTASIISKINALVLNNFTVPSKTTVSSLLTHIDNPIDQNGINGYLRIKDGTIRDFCARPHGLEMKRRIPKKIIKLIVAKYGTSEQFVTKCWLEIKNFGQIKRSRKDAMKKCHKHAVVNSVVSKPNEIQEETKDNSDNSVAVVSNPDEIQEDIKDNSDNSVAIVSNPDEIQGASKGNSDNSVAVASNPWSSMHNTHVMSTRPVSPVMHKKKSCMKPINVGNRYEELGGLSTDDYDHDSDDDRDHHFLWHHDERDYYDDRD